MSAIEIRPESYSGPVAKALVAAALADLGERYDSGNGDDTPIGPADFEPPAGAFLVAWLDGEPVGCGAWRTFHEDPDAAEIKRMYTVPAARRRGVAAALLTAVEESARSSGRTRAILETGDRQPEAVALYLSAGYVRIPDFGYYRDAPGVRSFGREL